MITDAMRVELHEYIKVADEDRIKELFEIMMIDKNFKSVQWYEDEEFLAELDERTRRLEAGIDKGVTLEELEANIEERRKLRSSGR